MIVFNATKAIYLRGNSQGYLIGQDLKLRIPIASYRLSSNTKKLMK